MRVIIAGGRDFSDYEMLKERLDFFLQNNIDKDIKIISGKAKGADSLGERYAIEKCYDLIEMSANWDKYGKSAGYRRNEDMASIADVCVCFWDGYSKGTKHMIDLAEQYNVKLRIVKYGNC